MQGWSIHVHNAHMQYHVCHWAGLCCSQQPVHTGRCRGPAHSEVRLPHPLRRQLPSLQLPGAGIPVGGRRQRVGRRHSRIHAAAKRFGLCPTGLLPATYGADRSQSREKFSETEALQAYDLLIYSPSCHNTISAYIRVLASKTVHRAARLAPIARLCLERDCPCLWPGTCVLAVRSVWEVNSSSCDSSPLDSCGAGSGSAEEGDQWRASSQR